MKGFKAYLLLETTLSAQITSAFNGAIFDKRALEIGTDEEMQSFLRFWDNEELQGPSRAALTKGEQKKRGFRWLGCHVSYAPINISVLKSAQNCYKRFGEPYCVVDFWNPTWLKS